MTGLIAVMTLISLSVPAIMAGPTDSTKSGSVEVHLVLSKAIYRSGDPVEITLTLANRASEGIAFQFNSGQMYDFIVLSENRVFWRWSEGRVFTQSLTSLVLKPGESKVFHEQWDQRNAEGQQAPASKYEMIAVFPAGGGRSIRPGSDGPRVLFTISSISGPVKPQQLPSVSSRSTTIAGSAIDEVLINDRPVLRLRRAAGGISASERAAIVAARLQSMVARGLKPVELAVLARNGEMAIEWKGELLVTVDANHARVNNTTPGELARKWLQLLAQGLSG